MVVSYLIEYHNPVAEAQKTESSELVQAMVQSKEPTRAVIAGYLNPLNEVHIVESSNPSFRISPVFGDGVYSDNLGPQKPNFCTIDTGPSLPIRWKCNH